MIRSEDAIAFLEQAARNGVSVIGADGFRADGADLLPDLGVVLDLSGLEDGAHSANEAKAFIAAVSDPGLLFEFVLRDRSGAP